jgi:UDP-N-acetylmuramyl pentapeptide phosphotransferase/UDP-N-acetylglucosamine-1-phosphate transferase
MTRLPLPALPPLALGVLAFAATLVLARMLRARWADRRAGAEALRKPRLSAVPSVGGAALLAALALGGEPQPFAALAAAFALGTLDDRRGLPAGAKLAGQVVVGLLLALGLGAFDAGALPVLGWVAAAVVAQNALNTWDHADGTATGLALLALWPWAGMRAALLGFLPTNLLLRRAGRAGERVPLAYLGDAGSHLLAVLIAARPAAWPLLVLPLLDLARVCVLRVRSGRPVWEGDRRHLAHRFEAAGWTPAAAAFAALLPALPLVWLDRGAALAAGVALCALLLAALVAASEDPGPARRAG